MRELHDLLTSLGLDSDPATVARAPARTLTPTMTLTLTLTRPR